MDLHTKNPKSATPMKDPHGFQSKLSENSNPNLSHSSPFIYSPRNKIRERRFVVAKKKSKKGALNSNPTPVDCKCKEKYGDNVNKCLCVAYETLRASQEEFFKNRNDEEKGETDKEKGSDYKAMIEFEEEEIKNHFVAQNLEIEDRDGSDTQYSCESEKSGQMGSSTIKRRRDKLLEDARNSAPDSGKVKHLVDAFEKLFTLPNPKESDKTEEDEIKENRKKAMQWALPGLQHPKVLPETEYSSSSFSLPRFQPADVSETNVSSSSFCPSDFCLTSENLGLDSRISLSSSWDGSQGSNASRSFSGGRRSRRNSAESRQSKGEDRKEEEFTKKIQEIMMEEERLRIPVAQGLPWTTDEPECLIKPPVKENTRPVDLKLHSDIRAVERADFDHQVSEKMSLIEQYKMERERQRKVEEEEEIRRLRKELVPKAQPMPYFDRPFIPRRSLKHPTVPRDPKFHIPQHKKIKSCVSWSDVRSYTYEQ
ncbi:hypothetical protein OIU78_026175 [Salix suchowensis]|nr:hypothetical protein OIU78_026175 [Salix suchowensis]